MGVSEASVDEGGEPCGLEVGEGFPVPGVVEFDVMSFPPVLLRAQAIQTPECPVEVPISSARV